MDLRNQDLDRRRNITSDNTNSIGVKSVFTLTMDHQVQLDKARQIITKDDFLTVVNKKRRSSDPETA